MSIIHDSRFFHIWYRVDFIRFMIFIPSHVIDILDRFHVIDVFWIEFMWSIGLDRFHVIGDHDLSYDFMFRFVFTKGIVYEEREYG